MRKNPKETGKEIAKETSTLLSLLRKQKIRVNLLSFTCISEFTLGLWQISDVLVHKMRRWEGHCSINFPVCSLCSRTYSDVVCVCCLPPSENKTKAALNWTMWSSTHHTGLDDSLSMWLFVLELVSMASLLSVEPPWGYMSTISIQ